MAPSSSKRASRPAAVISSTVFDLDIVFSAITTTFLSVVDQSNTCTQIARPVWFNCSCQCDFALCNTWPLSNSQGRVATLTGEADFLLLVVSHSSRYSLQKNYSYIFAFVKVMSKVLSVVFFLDTDPKTAFFTDVTITSSLHSVVQVIIEHLRFFRSHGLSG